VHVRTHGPFLKWAGGKRQLLAQLRRFYPPTIGCYFEPFVGSGAVFFDLMATGRLHRAPAALSDENADLIGTYLRVRDDTEAVIAALSELEAGHQHGGRDHYYAIRDRQFNPGRDAWRARGGQSAEYPVGLAAMLLYLNRTGYNGLFRLNANGHFNVPAGRYDKLSIVNAERLRSAAQALDRGRVTISTAPFDAAVEAASKGDLIYFDPPYAPLSATANFRSYTARGFTVSDQVRLRDLAIELAARGAAVVLSNSTAPGVVALYDQRAVRRAGLKCWRVSARRAINSRSDRRGEVEELIVTNVTPRHGLHRRPSS
jgi:DNA adenine methylase